MPLCAFILNIHHLTFHFHIFISSVFNWRFFSRFYRILWLFARMIVMAFVVTEQLFFLLLFSFHENDSRRPHLHFVCALKQSTGYAIWWKRHAMHDKMEIPTKNGTFSTITKIQIINDKPFNSFLTHICHRKWTRKKWKRLR